MKGAEMTTFAALFVLALVGSATAAETEESFRNWVHNVYDVGISAHMAAEVEASWNYETNITDHNQEIMVAASSQTANYSQSMSQYMKSTFQHVKPEDPLLQRFYRKLAMIGDAALPAEQYEELARLKANMSQIYSTAKVCRSPQTPLASCKQEELLDLEPGITREFDNPDTPEHILAHLWNEWREQSGKKMRDQFIRYVELKNEAAWINGFEKNNGLVWRAPYVEPQFNYTDADFVNEVKRLYDEVKPLYQQLHAYVRSKLAQKHGPIRSLHDPLGPIPAHLLGNMWAQSWLGTLGFTQLYPELPKLDVTEEMKRQNYTARKMFEISDKFFTDLNLTAMPPSFWDDSMIEKPADGRDVTCHASAWDFYNAKDFRIKQCTDITMQDLFTVHHEMGHVEYFLQYKHQLVTFRDGANDGFHEAIGDVLALSVSTPDHLKKIGLLANDTTRANRMENDLNFQFSTALEKIAFLPFGLMLDMYRYDVFAGIIKPEELNAKWWEYVVNYQGICAPSPPRGEEYFDAGAKFHVPADVPYMRYFVSFIIQFQFHKALCEKAGHTGPLYTCDIDGSKEAGKAVADALKLGSTQPWQEAMRILTGSTIMDARPLLEFFEPLYRKLQELNKNNQVGWKNQPFCESGASDTFKAYVYTDYNPRAQEVTFASVEASWNYNTNITDYNREIMNAKAEASAKFDQDEARRIKQEFSNVTQTGDFTSKRLYDKLTKLGDAGLPSDKFTELQYLGTNMTEIYSTALVCRNQSITNIQECPKEQQMALEPHITQELSTSRDPDFLLYLWKAWRDASGKKMRPFYERYVVLKNEAAVLDEYANNAEAWRSPYVEPSLNYNDTKFLEDIDRVWIQLEPLYKTLHTFVRRKLWQQYPTAKINPRGPIPAHLLGNMWAQTWGAIQNFTQLYPNKEPLDVTQAMADQGYTPRYMFNVSDKFFTDLGLEPMPQRFWDYSMLEKPEGRNVTCHASAWDFYNQQDFRIKQCTAVTMDDFITVHHEMGHVEYYLQYKHLPTPFRRGANDGFHEAVGDVLSLSVSTPAHLKKIGLLPPNTPTNDNQLDLNFMYSTALEKIAFLPFGLMMDMYRYDIFSGKITSLNYNTKWWDYRLKYQGICAPVNRSEGDFDPGAKYHIPADVPYMRYFVSFVIQFQFHKALCAAANHTGPLYQCDIDGNKNAGKLLGDALKMGSSMPWQDVMETITGSREIDARPLIEFFEPLTRHLQAINDANQDQAGWSEDPICVPFDGTYPADQTTTTTTSIPTTPMVTSTAVPVGSTTTSPVVGSNTTQPIGLPTTTVATGTDPTPGGGVSSVVPSLLALLVLTWIAMANQF
ncbi:angiotensin-converting enzyme-like [Paramacrobiotus metropolitanus]|uniref:angiotensin-converting enzyme-like n=1 Tax=Paramacrobiotus metropolitanus TaxID=2943436 RepID=UPI0024464D48|nr:angiotensin-converting enzyme-like [Paramacrobiotus metropolitanus]XP_055334823.1 angiotensin-converting enzyme-like [Paramacrobiotus metropolitanus]